MEKDDFISFLEVIGASDKLTAEEVDQALHEIMAFEPSNPKDRDRLRIYTMEHVMLDAIKREEM